MKRMTGIGGIFYKANDRATLGAWDARHLGIPIQDWGDAVFPWREMEGPGRRGSTVWNLFPADTAHMTPSTKPFMVNFRVENLRALLAALRAEGCAVDDKIEDSEFGKFGWVMDPEGNRIELWEPPAGT